MDYINTLSLSFILELMCDLHVTNKVYCDSVTLFSYMI
jgi:hypothetical protein